MNSRKDDENLLRMSKDDLQRWIQEEVDRNPHLIQRREQLAQVEEWVKQKEREATCTRMLYGNACESVLECESVMKGLYGMLGLEYRDEDSEEEGGGQPLNAIHITDDEEDGQKNCVFNGDADDVVVIDLGTTKETLEPMLEKVTMAIQKSSRLVQDLVQMVNKTSSISTASLSPASSSSSFEVNRPSSTSTPETIRSESVTPKLEITNSITIVKTESLLKPELSSLFSSSERNPDSNPTIKTEPEQTELNPLEMSFSKQRKSSYNGPPLKLPKLEPQLISVTPDSDINRSINIKSEPQLTSVIKSELSSPPFCSKQFEIHNSVSLDSIKKDNSDSFNPESSAMIKTELGSSETLPLVSDDSKPSKSSVNEDSASVALNEPDPQVTPMTSLEMSTPSSSSEPMEIVSSENTESVETNQTESVSTTEIPSEVSSLANNSEEADANASHDSESSDKAEMPNTRSKSAKSSVPNTSPTTSLRTSKKSAPVTSTSTPQKDTASAPSVADSTDELSDIEDSPASPAQSDEASESPSESVANTADEASSNKAPAEPSSTDKCSKSSSSESSESSKTHKEIKLKVNMKVLGKRKHNSWCEGTIQEVLKEEHRNRYKVEFKNGKSAVLPAHHVAPLKPPVLKDLFVGCRVVASCKDDKEKVLYNAAVLAELPERKNRMRFLVFYDDGHASYLALPDLFLVCKQLKKVWRDIEDEKLRSHVKDYLRVYPNPIAVVLRVGQDTRVVRNGKFETCTVLQLDGSLIHICFKRDKLKEWIYKGSDKLEHILNIKKRLAKERAKQQKTHHSASEKTKQPSQKKAEQPAQQETQQLQQQKVQQPPQKTQQPILEKTQQPPQKTQQPILEKTQQPPQKTHLSILEKMQLLHQQKTQQSVKSAGNAITTSSSAPVASASITSAFVSPSVCERVTRQSNALDAKKSISLQKSKSPAFQPKVIIQRLSISEGLMQTVKSPGITTSNLRSAKRPVPNIEEDDDVFEEEEHISEQGQNKSVYLPHRCCPACVDGVRPSQINMHHGQNPLLIPLLFKFRRMTARRRIDGKLFFHIFYRSPCGRSLCDMQEVQEYLFKTRCDFLFLEMFCMDPFVLVNRARPPSTTTGQPRLYLPDISEGKEVLPVPCVNEVDSTVAPSVAYIKDRIAAPNVSINTSSDFLIGCDCTDGCRDRSKCACQQLTIEATSLCSGGPVDVSAGYAHKRLPTTLPTGLYECNPLCRCDPRMCSNRLVQHGLQLRLELFMTQHKGWGIRCRDDVAKGTFVCVFTGKVVNEDKMNEDDTVSGNEYLANLDFIEGVEKLKEGYESEAYSSDTEVESNKKTITMKTGPLRKNTLYQKDSSSEGEEPMELDTEKAKKQGQETSGPKRCFAIKSFQRRVKPQETTNVQNERGKSGAKNTRRLFNKEETCYVIDARQEGNISRYINHSCSPNLFVQNIFVDTHDLRFPWVAFFASKRIKAGTELTWDYNYEVGSVEGKVLLCCCGSLRCTGRLL